MNLGSNPVTCISDRFLNSRSSLPGLGTNCRRTSSSLLISTSRTPGCRKNRRRTSFFSILLRFAIESGFADESKFRGTFGGCPNDFITVET